MNTQQRIGVIGGGVLGVSTATHLARRGASVVLVSDGPLAGSASGRSLSWLNSAGERSEHYHLLRMAGIDRYRTLAARYPDANWLRFDGGLTWRNAGEGPELRAAHAHELSVGYDSVLVTPDQVRERFVAVDPAAVSIDGAIWNPGEGWVDLPSLVAVLVEEFRALGGQVVTQAGPATVEMGDNRVRAVRAAAGDRWRVDAVVLATGAGVPEAAAELGVTIPEKTPLALLVRTKPVTTDLRLVLNTPRAAVRPAPGGSLCVDADWVTPSIVSDGEARWSAPDDVVGELLAEGSRLLAGHPTLRPAEVGIGHKPMPADGQPVVGELPGVPGVYVVFTHSGATLGLIIGDLLADQVLSGQPPTLLARFTPDRFAGSITETDRSRGGVPPGAPIPRVRRP